MLIAGQISYFYRYFHTFLRMFTPQREAINNSFFFLRPFIQPENIGLKQQRCPLRRIIWKTRDVKVHCKKYRKIYVFCENRDIEWELNCISNSMNEKSHEFMNVEEKDSWSWKISALFIKQNISLKSRIAKNNSYIN